MVGIAGKSNSLDKHNNRWVSMAMCRRQREEGYKEIFLKDKTYSFNKYYLSTYNIMGNVLNARDSVVNQTHTLALWGLYSNPF